jgi:2-polyprenyl-6-methoxyphenol hydroxylase-like FAD-dependent oxidoreductase
VGDIGRELSPFPFLLILGQDENERLLGEALRAHGIDVRWRTALVGLRQDAGRVTATLEGPDGAASEVEAGWVAGCDGARSAVRERLGLDFVGAPYEHVFFVADTRVTGPMAPGELNVYLWRDGFHLFFPMRGADHWRVVGIVPPELRGRDDLGLDDVLPSLRTEAGARLAFQECSWFSTYRIHHRRATRFRQGRCFLLGDAAHIHSPVGAQGMNTGLQDAYNLAWKLALVVSGRVAGGDAGPAAQALLDSYEAERVPVADRLLRTTDQAFRLVVSSRGLAGFVRTQLAPRGLALAMRSERVRALAFRTISQIGIRYPTSPLSQTLPGLPAGGPAAGDRFPWLRLVFEAGGAPEDLFTRLDDRRFNLLVFGQPWPQDQAGCPADLLATQGVPEHPANERELERAGIPRPSFYLLRPDGHVGLAGARLDTAALAHYLSDRFALRAAR